MLSGWKWLPGGDTSGLFVCRNLTRKDLLTYHLQRHATMFRNSRHAEAFQCLPTTFNLPKEFEAFEKAFMQSATKPAAASKPGAPCRARPEQKAGLNVWIMKPSSSSRGRGIHLLDDISAAVCSQPSVVQRYVTDPYLYQGYKFDLRLYVVVTSFNPLEAFIFKVSFSPDDCLITLQCAMCRSCRAIARHHVLRGHSYNASLCKLPGIPDIFVRRDP